MMPFRQDVGPTPLGDLPRSRTECRVCRSTGGTNHLNYGAVSCLSCRAFFRRATKNRNKVFKCKKQGSCFMSKGTRSNCKPCRYDTCLRVGMDQGLVIADRVASQSSKQIARENSQQMSLYQYIGCQTVDPIEAEIESKQRTNLLNILRDWVDLLAESTLDPRLVPNLGLAHSGVAPGSSQILRSHLDTIDRQVERFARKTSVFQDLLEHDRTLILSWNLQMSSTFVWARYLGKSSSGFEQIKWLLLSFDGFMSQVDPEQFKGVVQMLEWFQFHFPDQKKPSQVQAIMEHIVLISSYQMSNKWVCMIAFASLFHIPPDFSFLLKQPERVRGVFGNLDNYLDILQWNKSSFTSLIHSVHELTGLIADLTWIDGAGPLASRSIKELEHPSRMSQLFQDMSLTIRSIDFGPALVHEVIKLNFDVPVSPEFLPRTTQRWSVRLRGIMDLFKEFQVLDDNVKGQILYRSSFAALGLINAWNDGIGDPEEQVHFFLGTRDLSQYKSVIQTISNVVQPKLLSLPRCVHPSRRRSVIPTLDTMAEGWKELKAVIADLESFYLLLLFVLFRPAAQMGIEKVGEVKNLSHHLEALIIKKDGGSNVRLVQDQIQTIEEMSRALNSIVQASL